MTGIPLTEQTIVALLVVAALVAIAVSRLRLPYTIALVGVGLFLGFGDVVDLHLTRELILLVFLPPLLFEGSLNMDVGDLRRRWGQVATMASIGTAVAVGVIAGGFLLLGFGIPEALLFGVILAPTDPVSVLAVFKEHGVGTGLRTLMEGESIFNDAIAIVLYLIAVDVVEGSAITASQAVFDFGTEVVVGTLVGVTVGIVVHRLMTAVDDHLVEITLSFTAAYGAYLLAQSVHGSGLIATVAAGLLIANYGTGFAMSASSRIALYDFWEVVAFMVNSLLFLLMGASFDVTRFTEGPVARAILVAFGAMLAARALTTYGILRPFGRGPRENAIPRAWFHALFWGGLRGAIPIALVLGLSDRTVDGVDAVAVVFGVVLLSLLGQGLTFRPLLTRLGLTGPGEEVRRFEDVYARGLALRSSLDELETMRRRGEIAAPVYEALRDELGNDLEQIEDRMREIALDSDAARARQIQRTARRLAAAQRAAIRDAIRRGIISQETGTLIQQEIDETLEQGASDPDRAAERLTGIYPPDPDGDQGGSDD